jgi:hypothetical protein
VREIGKSHWRTICHMGLTFRVVDYRVYKGEHTNSKNLCQRLLQCETCHIIRHRDIIGASNIAFVWWHQRCHGRHPCESWDV